MLLPSQNPLDEIIGEPLKLFKLQANSRHVSILNQPLYPSKGKKTRFPSKGKVGIATVETNFGDSSHCVWRLIQLLPSLRTLSHITRGCLRRCCRRWSVEAQNDVLASVGAVASGIARFVVVGFSNV